MMDFQTFAAASIYHTPPTLTDEDKDSSSRKLVVFIIFTTIKSLSITTSENEKI